MSDTKKCPYCAEEIQAAAIKCKHCGMSLTPNDGTPIGSFRGRGDAGEEGKQEKKTSAPKMIVQLVLFAFVAWILITVFGSAVRVKNSMQPETTQAPNQGGTPKTQSAPNNQPYVTTAIDLFQAYNKNEVATNQKINGRPVQISGTIASIDEDFTNSAVLQLQTTDSFSHVGATLADSEKQKAAQLEKGMPVTVLCEKVIRIVESPIGSNCTIINNNEKAAPQKQKQSANIEKSQITTATSISEKPDFSEWQFSSFTLPNGNFYCSITSAVKNKDIGQNIIIKARRPGSQLIVDMYKDNWNRAPGSKVNIEFDFADNQPLPLSAYADSHILDVQIPPMYTATFLLELVDNAALRAILPEETWVINNRNAREAVQQMVSCLK